MLDSCRALEAEGFDVTYISVKSNGLIDLSELEAAIRPSTSLVSVMMVNNEIGVKQPIKEIGAICRRVSRFQYCVYSIFIIYNSKFHFLF